MERDQLEITDGADSINLFCFHPAVFLIKSMVDSNMDFLLSPFPGRVSPPNPNPNQPRFSRKMNAKRQKTRIQSVQRRPRRLLPSSSPLEDNLREHKPEPEVGRAEESSHKAKPEISEKIAEKQMESREKDPEKEVKSKESLSDAIADESQKLNTGKEENESPEKQTLTDKTTEGIPGKTPESTEKKDKEKDSKQKLKILKRPKKDEDEANKLMLINIGAALVVLLAIGAYTAFNFSYFPKSTK